MYAIRSYYVINTIPVRLTLNNEEPLTFRSLLQLAQTQFLESASYHHSSLSEIQSLTPLKSRLFDHILVYENYPIDETIQKNRNNFV